MKIEVRENTVVISGYVNAVERWSKPIRSNLRGKMQSFVEKIKAGVFGTALKRNNKVEVRLNHDANRVLANTADGTAILEEDNIGLRAEVTITDAEVIEKAKNNKLVGWSFGFYANSDEVDESGEMATRSISDMDLVEVSILDDTKSPAYYGTSIETRNEGGAVMEIRENIADEPLNIDKLADLVVEKVLEKLKTTEENRAEETKPEETAEKEKIDYSEYEERLKKLSSNSKEVH